MEYQEDKIVVLLCKKTLGEPLSDDEQAELTKWVKLNEKQLFNFEVAREELQKLTAFSQGTEEALRNFKIKYGSQFKN